MYYKIYQNSHSPFIWKFHLIIFIKQGPFEENYWHNFAPLWWTIKWFIALLPCNEKSVSQFRVFSAHEWKRKPVYFDDLLTTCSVQIYCSSLPDTVCMQAWMYLYLNSDLNQSFGQSFSNYWVCRFKTSLKSPKAR